MCETEVIKDSTFTNYAKRIERENLREFGSSLSFSGIAHRASLMVKEVRPDEGTLIVYKGWRDAMRRG